MKEVRRLLESSASPFAREVLRAGLGDAPPPEAMGRAAAALGLTVAAVAVAVPAGAAAATVNGVVAGGLGAASKASGVSTALLGKWLLSGLAAGVVVSGTATVVERARAPAAVVHEVARAPSAPAAKPAPTGAVPRPSDVVLEPVEPATRPSATAAFPGAASEPSTAPAAPESSTSRALGAEAARIDAARQALERGDVRRALIELDWYERARVVGVLDREAELLRIQALVRAGERARAVELARAYLTKHPRDAYAARLGELIRSGGATTGDKR
jgi:hypothetical protein